tara:strand:+ start:653 stop:2431 length:1779 start_codon:yes stop_codon:yes gene_type:complete
MSNYGELKIGDSVFVLITERDRNDSHFFDNISRSSLGVITHIKDSDTTPFIYRVQVSDNNPDLDVKSIFDLHAKQIVLVSDSDSFRNRQFMHYNRPEELYVSSDASNYAVIVNNKEDGWVTFLTDQTSNNTASITPHLVSNLSKVSQLSIDNMPPELLSKILKGIADSQRFDRNGWYEKCPYCSTWIGEDCSFKIEGEGFVCVKCYKDYIYDCSLCENEVRILDSNLRILDNKKICGKCFDTRIWRCTECGKSHADEKYFEYDSYRYCSSCYDRRAISVMSSPTRMLSRSYINKISLGSGKEYIANRSKTAVAVEIEAVADFEYDEDDEDSDYSERDYNYPSGWSDIGDSSIDSNNGREFIMEPDFGDDALRKISIFCKWLKNENFYVDNSCGLHVHTDAYYSGIEQLKGVLLVSRALEPFIYNMIPKHRSESRYSKPMDEIDSDIILGVKSAKDFCDLWYGVMNGTNASTEKYNDSRYRGLNLHSRFLHGTIEYRYHHGTINDYYINNWVLLCLAISDFGNNFLSLEKKPILDLFINKESKDLSDYLSVMGISNLIPYVNEMILINSPEYDNLPKNDNKVRLSGYSIQQIQ